MSAPDPFDRLRWCDSYSRIPTLLDLHTEPATDRWWQELGKAWSISDNIGAYRLDLMRILADATPHQRDLMMSGGERQALSMQTELLTVYRGCYEFNMRGLSWSLNRAVAAVFPFLTRHAHHRRGLQPVLLTGRVRRDRCVLKLDRNEQEIIATRVRRLRIDKLEVAHDLAA